MPSLSFAVSAIAAGAAIGIGGIAPSAAHAAPAHTNSTTAHITCLAGLPVVAAFASGTDYESGSEIVVSQSINYNLQRPKPSVTDVQVSVLGTWEASGPTIRFAVRGVYTLSVVVTDISGHLLGTAQDQCTLA